MQLAQPIKALKNEMPASELIGEIRMPLNTDEEASAQAAKALKLKKQKDFSRFLEASCDCV